MKTSYIKLFAAVCALSYSMSASAQALHSGYFLEGMVQRHELNAAFGGESNFVVVPAVSGLEVGVSTNFGMENFFFNRNGELHLGLSPKVSAQEFLSKLPQNNQMEIQLEVPIAGVGFRALGGFNTVSIKERTFVGASIPSSLFSFLKLGADPTTGIAQYNINNLWLQTNNYVELALGHSRKLELLEGLTYGAKVKFLFGAFGATMHLEHINIAMSQNSWNINTLGEMALSSGVQMKVDNKGNIVGVDASSLHLGGFGMGIDLGAVYTLPALPELTVSLALNDIGFISWGNMDIVRTKESFVFEGFTEIGATEAGSVEEQINGLVNELGKLIQVEELAPTSQAQSLYTTLNVGAEYSILDRKISFGLLSSTRFGTPQVYAEGMAVVNFRPLSWLQASINGSVSTYGGAMGLLINFCPNGANVFIGCDYITPSMKFSPQGIPVKGMRANLRAGVAITFGKQ